MIYVSAYIFFFFKQNPRAGVDKVPVAHPGAWTYYINKTSTHRVVKKIKINNNIPRRNYI